MAQFDFRTGAAGLVALLLPFGVQAASVNPFLLGDQGADAIFLARDLNGDGDTNDEGEVTTFFDASNRAGLGAASNNVFKITQARDGSVLFGDGDTDSVYRLRDRNGDGNAQGKAESQLWFSGSQNAAGVRLNTPNGIAEGPDGAVYVVEADTNGSPTGDWVYRTVDLNGDGDANDAGEVTKWLDLKAANPSSSPFEIRFDGNTAYIADTAGATANVIYAATDSDGNGVIEGAELTTFISDDNAYGARFDFAIAVGDGSVWSWEWIADNGIASVFRYTDLDGSGVIDAAAEVVEAWNTSLLDDAYGFLAGFSMDYDALSGALLITSNGANAASTWVTRLVDLDGDGRFWSEGETSTIWSQLDHGSLPNRPRAVASYAPPAAVPLPAGLVLMLTGLGGLGAFAARRRR